MSFSAFGLLLALGLCIPTHPLALLPGLPLEIRGGLLLVVVIAITFAIGKARLPRARIWIGLALALIGLRIIVGVMAPKLGFEARYWSDELQTRPFERGTYGSRENQTREDVVLSFDGAGFPVHFFNDIRRFNFYRPTDQARDTLPFSVRWHGVIASVPPGTAELALISNGPATVALNGSNVIDLDYVGSVVERRVHVSEIAIGSSIDVGYARKFEAYPTLRAFWVDHAGNHSLVGAPNIVQSEADLGRASLSGVLQTLASVTSVALLAMLLLAAVVALRQRKSRQGGWSMPERAFVALLVVWAATESFFDWSHLERQTVLLSGGNDWLAYEAFARDIQLNGLLMNYGRPPGTGDPYYYQPAYAYVLAGMHWLLGESLAGILWAQQASTGVVAALVFGLTRTLWHSGAAIIAALLVMIYRPLELTTVSNLLLSENLLFLVLPLILWLMVRAFRAPSARTAALAGFGLGLAGLTRSTPLLLFPIAILGVAWYTLRARGWRRSASLSVLFGIACFGTVGLATIRNTIVSGKPTLITSSAGANLIEAHRPGPNVDLRNVDQNATYNALGLDRATREVAEFIRQDPGGYLSTLWPTAAFALGYAEAVIPGRGVEWPLTGLVAAYLVCLLSPASWRATGSWILHAFVLTHWAQTVIFFSHQYGFRLPLPMYLVMCAVVANGVWSLLSSVARPDAWLTRRARQGLIVVGGIAGIALTLWSVPGWLHRFDSAPERLYTLEGDPATIARIYRELPDLDRTDRVYGAGLDTRTREIAYLRSLAFPLIKWFDASRGTVFPGRTQPGIMGVSQDQLVRGVSDCAPRLERSPPGFDLYRLDAETLARCTPVGDSIVGEFEDFARVIKTATPRNARPGDALSVTTAWEVIARPLGRYRESIDLLSPQKKLIASSENNAYGTDLWASGEIIISNHLISIPQTTPPIQDTLALRFFGANPAPVIKSDSTYETTARLDSIELLPPVPIPSPGSFGVQVPGEIQSRGVSLISAALSRDSVHPGDSVDLSMIWTSSVASPSISPRQLQLVGPMTVPLISELTPLNGQFPLGSWRQGETVLDERSLVIPATLTAGAYDLRLKADPVNSAPRTLAALTITEHSRQMTPPPIRAALETRFGNVMEIVGYDLRNRRIDAGDSVDLGLVWHALSASANRNVVIITLIDEQGRVVFRREIEPADGSRPTPGWITGEFVTDLHRIRTSRDLDRGKYRVGIEVADKDSGAFLRTARGERRILLDPDITVD